MHDARFEYFAAEVWPRLREGGASGLLIFASSYFEFVRLRNFLKAEGASLAVYCEYTPAADVMRTRGRFQRGERRVMLFTERAQFYFRPKIRGIRDVVFYSLPQHPQFYVEVANWVTEGGHAEALHSTIQVLFGACDALALARVVGQKHAKRMLADASSSFLFT